MVGHLIVYVGQLLHASHAIFLGPDNAHPKFGGPPGLSPLLCLARPAENHLCCHVPHLAKSK